ncbi:MAG: glycine cleavage system protein GcvH [Deltaproteobacteria bacterium]|nr:glycine cleavage system protein GcvH [Deltaproteobacteria bacterium]
MAENLKFTEDHLWVRVSGKRVQVGISDYFQDELGEILTVELPDVGDVVERGESFGEIESVTTVTDLLAPVSGTISATNGDLDDTPSLVNEDPYHEGWLLEIELSDKTELEELMEPDEYEDMTAGGAEEE